jgi:hypothetical protein
MVYLGSLRPGRSALTVRNLGVGAALRGAMIRSEYSGPIPGPPFQIGRPIGGLGISHSSGPRFQTGNRTSGRLAADPGGLRRWDLPRTPRGRAPGGLR